MSKGRHIHKKGKPVEINEERLLIDAQKLHDDRGCRCDPKYIRSCPKFAQAILDTGKAMRESGK